MHSVQKILLGSVFLLLSSYPAQIVGFSALASTMVSSDFSCLIEKGSRVRCIQYKATGDATLQVRENCRVDSGRWYRHKCSLPKKAEGCHLKVSSIGGTQPIILQRTTWYLKGYKQVKKLCKEAQEEYRTY